MKKIYTLLIVFLCVFSIDAQNNDFNNGGGDLLWSNTANWSLGVVPNTTNTGQVRLLLDSESLVNTPITIKKIQNTFGTTVNTPLAGASVLTIDPGANNAYGFENVSNSDVNMIFNGLVTVNNTGSGTTQTLMRNQNGNTNDTNSIVFGDGSTLTLTTNLELRSGSGSNDFNFNGTLAGSAALRISANTTATFGSTSNNTGFTGSIVYIGNPGLVVVNTTDNNVFMPSGQKIQVNATGGEVELNGANVYQGNITVGGTNSFTMDLNKNQNSIGTVILSASGTLNLDVDATVTELAFADNSASSWGTGTINITGFKDGVIRFGTSNSGLTSAQLSQITVDDGSNGLVLDSNGYLYSYDTSWSGASSTDWSTAGNWSDGAPTSGQDVYIADVANAPIIDSSTGVTLGDLIIDEADGLTITGGGSLIVNGSSTGNVTYNRTLTSKPANADGWHLVSSPVAGEVFDNSYVTDNSIASGSSDNLGIATYNNGWTYLQSPSGSISSTSGIGYSMKRSSDGSVPFTGTINTTDLNGVVVSASDSDFVLLGVPYTSYMSSQTFLNDNTNLDQSQIWIWQQGTTGGNYIANTAKADNFILAPGQGFFVKKSSIDATVNFAESNQLSNADTFLKSSKTEVKLFVNDGTNDRFAKMYYLDNVTKGFDVGYEGEVFGGVENSFDVYSDLLENSTGKKYQVQSLPKSEMETMTIPIGIKAAAGKEITFTAEATNLPNDLKVYLEDRDTNTFTELASTNNYKVTLNNVANGIGRFYLHTKSSSVLSADTENLDNISIYTTNRNNIRITGVISDAKVKLFNILGKQVFESKFSSKGVSDIAIPTVSTGVYIIQLTTVKGKLNKKIVLE